MAAEAPSNDRVNQHTHLVSRRLHQVLSTPLLTPLPGVEMAFCKLTKPVMTVTAGTDLCTNRCEINVSLLGHPKGHPQRMVMGGKEPIPYIQQVESHELTPEQKTALSKKWKSNASSEFPGTPVLIHPFYMMRNEVTREAWAEFQTRSPLFSNGTQIRSFDDLDKHPLNPISAISAQEARAYCHWLGGELPTETQWEFVARSGGTSDVYPWGNAPVNCHRAVMGLTKCSKRKSSPVCSRVNGISKQEICDLAGNVFEFVLTVFPTRSEMMKWPTIFRLPEEQEGLPTQYYKRQLEELPLSLPRPTTVGNESRLEPSIGWPSERAYCTPRRGIARIPTHRTDRGGVKVAIDQIGNTFEEVDIAIRSVFQSRSGTLLRASRSRRIQYRFPMCISCSTTVYQCGDGERIVRMASIDKSS